MPYQHPLNVVARVDPAKFVSLEAFLNAHRQPIGAQALLPFDQLEEIHFARVVLFPASQDSAELWIPPTLMLSTDADGPADSVLARLVERGSAGIDALFSHCESYPAAVRRTDASRIAYLKNHCLKVQAFYVNTLGRTVREVGQNAHLRQAIDEYIDRRARTRPWSGTGALEARNDIREFVRSRPDLAWAVDPYTPARPSKAAGWLKLALAALPALVILGLMLVFPVLLVIPVLLLVALRFHEVANIADNYRPPVSRIQRHESNEDHRVQNQLSATGYVQKGIFRRLLLRVMLWVLALAARNLYNRGQLSGVDTIHFARWVLFDSGRRVCFMSNYDGSSESYMDDFIDRVAFGLNIVFSNGKGWPPSRFLIQGGAHNEQGFKAFFRDHQLTTHIWYAAPAYDRLTAVNIGRDEKIRSGLAGHMNENQAAEWLRLL